MLASLLYSLTCLLLDVVATSRGDQSGLQAEVLALRRQVQVLERQIKRVRWSPRRSVDNRCSGKAPSEISLGWITS